MNEKRITSITPITGQIYKGMTNSGRRGFILDVTYLLDDGTTEKSNVSANRKKDVLPRLERDRANAATGAMKASYFDGRFSGTVSRYTIGMRGLEATPDHVLGGSKPQPEPAAVAA